ncbi:hypothetical protein [Archangium sp.]|uniref:hypothetical protein n=1 Tax=Archangium sp. TaxID=1872627 RepID=UPI00286A5960|nr:hypothetical protein [Archangium sp.]
MHIYRRLTLILVAAVSLDALALEADAPKTEASKPGGTMPDLPKAPLSSDLLKSGSAISYGFTAGAGLSLSGYTIHGPALKQTLPAAMPYLAFFPFAAFGVRGNESRAYCAARFLSDSKAAEKYADSMATYRTQVALDKTDVTDEEVKEVTKWERRTPARCGVYTLLGIYVGKPSGFKANSEINGIVKARTFSSYASVGLISAPVSFFTGFAGVSFWSVEDGETGTNRNAAALTVGLGTNVDVLSLLLK